MKLDLFDYHSLINKTVFLRSKVISTFSLPKLAFPNEALMLVSCLALNERPSSKRILKINKFYLIIHWIILESTHVYCTQGGYMFYLVFLSSQASQRNGSIFDPALQVCAIFDISLYCRDPVELGADKILITHSM